MTGGIASCHASDVIVGIDCQQQTLTQHVMPCDLNRNNTTANEALPNVLVTNVRSIRSVEKIDEVDCVIRNNNIHVACLTESWLSESISSDIVSMCGFSCFRRDRNDGRRGGGVVLYVNDALQSRRLSDLECGDVESLWVLCRYPRMPRSISHILFGAIYFPPNGDGVRTVNHILNCIDRVTQKHPYVGVILLGDFNKMNDRFILSYPLKQIVSLATRRNNTLDKIYTNIADCYDAPCILPPIGLSDHNVVIVRASRCVNRHSNSVIFNIIRSNDPTGKTLLAHELSRFNWASLYRMDDCNAMLNLFYHTVISLLDRYLPVRVSSRHATEKPWVNDKFRNLIRQRQKAWKEQDMAKYRALRNLVQRTSNKLRSKYYNRGVKSLRDAGPRQWWGAVKRITGQTRQSPLNCLSSNGNIQQLADAINSFFTAFQPISLLWTCLFHLSQKMHQLNSL